MDCVKMENASKHPMLNELREKASLILSLLDGLPKDCQMEGLQILQDIINLAVCRMTGGRVPSVRFVPCDGGSEGELSHLRQDVLLNRDWLDGRHEFSEQEIKEEPIEWTIVAVSGNELKCMNDDLHDKSENVSVDIEANGQSLPNHSQYSKTLPRSSVTAVRGTRKRRKRSCFDSRRSSMKRRKRVAENSKIEKELDLNDKKIDLAAWKDSLSKARKGKDADVGVRTEDDSLSAKKENKNSDIKSQPDDLEDDKEAVLSKIPLKLRLKLSKKQIKSEEVKKFSCSDCSFSTNKRLLLEYHMTRHTGTGKFMCDQCHKCFTAASSLRRHLQMHQGVRPFACEVCGKTFIDVFSLRTHHVVHTGERLFNCDKCDKVYTNSSNLSRHRRVHTGAQPYVCKTCNVKFRDMSSLKLHMLKHTGEKPYLCEVCNKQFKTSSDFRRHERTHTGERKYRCKQCGKKFVQGWNLKQHERIHGDMRPWSCHICSKLFRTKYSRDHHVLRHSGVKQHQCKICQKWYTTKKSLSNHQVLHTLAKPFRCATCGRRFNQVANLRRHERIHSDLRPYKCKVCDKAFKYINSLQYHETIHTGSMLTCNKCGVSFRCKTSIRRHHCRMELLVGSDENSKEAKIKEEKPNVISQDEDDKKIATNGRDFTQLNSNKRDENSAKKATVSSLTLRNSVRKKSKSSSMSRSSQESNADVVLDFSKSKVPIGEEKNSAVDGLGNGRCKRELRNSRKRAEIWAEDHETMIGNVISVSISDSDGVSHPSVVIKQEICDIESEIFSIMAASSLG